VANHLTPTELAEELNMKRREVISKCMEMGVPIFNGRIDRSPRRATQGRHGDLASRAAQPAAPPLK
jgi:hypothetical protein